jgi:hypothetical protein
LRRKDGAALQMILRGCAPFNELPDDAAIAAGRTSKN